MGWLSRIRTGLRLLVTLETTGTEILTLYNQLKLAEKTNSALTIPASHVVSTRRAMQPVAEILQEIL